MHKYLILLSLLFLPVHLQASTLDWDVEGWPAGTLTQAYTDVDGSGIDITVNMTGDTGQFTAGFPVSGTDQLSLFTDYDNTTQSVTVTFTFSSPVTLSDMRIRDVDQASWDDRLIISGLDTGGGVVLPVNVVRGSNVAENAPGDYEASTNAVNPTNPNGFLTFSFDDVAVTQFSFTYTSGANANANPGAQFVPFDNIEFFLSTPILTIDKTASASANPANSGDTITYTIEIENDAAASGDATNIVVSDALPSGVTYVPSSAQKTYPTTTTTSYTSPNLGPVNVDGVNIATISFDTTGVLPAGAILDTYSFDVSGESLGASFRSEIDLIATYPGGTAFTLDFGTDLGLPNSAGTYSETQGPISVSGTAIGVYQFIWDEDFNDAGTDNAVSDATFTIVYTGRAPTTDAANAPVNMVTAADNITLKPGETLTVTFDVTVDGGISAGTLTNTATTSSNETSDISDTADVITVPVTLSSFQALSGDIPGAVNFYWTTATEVGNVAFNLYQQIDGEWELINDQPIPSHVIDSIQIQHYSYQAYGLDSQTFGIEDIDLYGAAVMHGPFPLNRAVGISQQPVQQRSPIKQKTPERIDWKAIGQEHRRNKAERKIHQQEQMQEKMNELDSQVVEDLSAWSGDTTAHKHRYVNYSSAGWILPGIRG